MATVSGAAISTATGIRGGSVNVKEAAHVALSYVADLYADEKIGELGLEEVEFDDPSQEWIITVGFARPWDYPPTLPADMMKVLRAAPRATHRTYKTVRMDDGGNVKSLKNRDV